jgi:two-component system phosphate regulon sensor histidine kinase PhoR
LDKGEIKVKNEKIDLKEIIQDVVKTASFRIAGLNGELRLHLPETPVYVFADKLHTTNLVNNLVDNAIKYSKNEIDISVHLEKIGNRAEFSVSDKGIGIKREHISKIFDKLYRVPMGNLHNVKGFGLGLSYVKVIAERFGWTLNVKSQYGIGSTFTVIIKNTL